MKRIVSLVLCILLILTMHGCGNVIERTNFYYRRIDFLYEEEAPVIAAETRDISGHAGELTYLISLYLAGPSSKKLDSPFPDNTQLLSADMIEGSIQIELSDLENSLSDAQFSLACACLTLTGLEFTEAESVTIISGERTLTMSGSDLLLYDSITANAATEAEE